MGGGKDDCGDLKSPAHCEAHLSGLGRGFVFVLGKSNQHESGLGSGSADEGWELNEVQWRGSIENNRMKRRGTNTGEGEAGEYLLKW
jgi:hypothetical protein